jgi:chromosome partitioning protein
MAKVIATVNMKGGVGKSTATFNLSHALVSRGKRVLAIDADPQATLTFLFEQDERALQLAEKTLYYSLVMDKPLSSIIIPTTPALIPSSIILSKADRELMATVRYTSSILREKAFGRFQTTTTISLLTAHLFLRFSPGTPWRPHTLCLSR